MTTFEIYFDGGTNGFNKSGSGGDGYGSWEVRWNGFSKKASRVQFMSVKFGQTITNNVAEYLSLTGALAWLQSVKQKCQYRIIIHGDSQLVLKTLTGEYKTKKPHLKTLRDHCQQLLKDFAGYSTCWQGRAHNLERFGH